MIGKNKINPKDFEEENSLPSLIGKGIGDGNSLIYDDGSLASLGRRKLEAIEGEVNNEGYNLGKIDLGYGDERYVVMKKSLIDAMGDPSSTDASEFKNALEETTRVLVESFGKTKLKPCESAFEENLFRSYVSSLMMCLVKYPHDIPDEKMLMEMGLGKKDVSKLYTMAAVAWLGSKTGTENIGINSAQDIVSCLDNFTYRGVSESINLSVDRCEDGSHYVLRPEIGKKVLDVQKETPKLSDTYLGFEQKIVSFIMETASSKLLRENPVNLVRTYLNMICCHKEGKPIPLDYGIEER